MGSDREADSGFQQEDPGQVLVRYQPIVRIIVRTLAFKGYLPGRDAGDLMQEVNRKLVERLPRILAQYNGKSQFRTYFSVVVRNLCLEELRKVRIVAEPQSDWYENTPAEPATDPLLLKNEYERLQRAVRMFGTERSALWIALRCCADMPVEPDHFLGFDKDPGPDVRSELAKTVNDTLRLQKKEKMEALSTCFSQLDRKPRNADAVRKWVSARQEELVKLMNGDPPVHAYAIDTLYILMERVEYPENNE